MGYEWYQYDRQLERAEESIKTTVQRKKNKEAILAFENHLVVSGLSKPRILRYLFTLKKLDQWFAMDFDQAAKKDVVAVLSKIEKMEYSIHTKHLYKVMIKRFFQWLHGYERKQYPEMVRWIVANIPKGKLSMPQKAQMITEEDVKKLLEASFNLRDKAFVSVLWESGCRIGELATLHIRSIKFDDYGAVLHVRGKTGERQIRVVNSSSHLANWFNMHPRRNDKNAPVWVCIGSVNYGKALEYASIHRLLKELFKRAGIDKPSHPHSFRHSRATFLANHLTEFQMNNYFGWTQGSDMPSTYVHLSGRDLDGAMLRLHGLKNEKASQESQMKARKCPKCSYLNCSESRYCSRCGAVVEFTELLKIQQKEDEVTRRRLFSDEKLNKLFTDEKTQEFLKQRMVEMNLES